MIFHDFGDFGDLGADERNLVKSDGWIGTRDVQMMAWGWFWTKKHRFYSIILTKNTLWTGRNTLEPV